MRNLKWISIAVLSSGFALTASAAGADTYAANMGGCNHIATSVREAVDANGQSGNLSEAQKEQGLGREFCNNQLYARGISHYQRALDLLGGKS